MNREFFKGVVWPRQGGKEHPPMKGRKPKKGAPADAEPGKIYRYAIVGMLVTEEPVPGWDSKEAVRGVALCGQTFGMADLFSMVHNGWAPQHLLGAEAGDVLVGLNFILPKDPGDE